MDFFIKTKIYFNFILDLFFSKDLCKFLNFALYKRGEKSISNRFLEFYTNKVKKEP